MKIPEIIEKLTRPKAPPVTDPAAFARKRYGGEFVETLRVERWKNEVYTCTTSQFEKLGKGFVRHCGPTAITNLILTLNRRNRYFQTVGTSSESGIRHDPEEIFLRVCEIGKRSWVYWNTDILHSMGGTYDILTGRYIRKSLEEFLPVPPDRIRVSRHISAGGSECLGLLQSGSLLYLQMHRHPCYGGHHVLCCGAVVLRRSGSAREKVFLIIADGWSHQLRYVDTRDLGLMHFYSIDVE